MNNEELFITALSFEEKVRDFYQSAADTIDDDRGKTIFRALADDEQSHMDFLHYSLKQLEAKGTIDINRLSTSIPTVEMIKGQLERLKVKIPSRMLGNLKTVWASALKLENETSAFYRDAYEKTDGANKEIFKKFLEIEERHADVAQIELDHAMNNGVWFNFMEVDLEAE
ncbi:MAG: ferritin-like domain-containing protein [Desulforhopalus sp.]